MTYLNETEKNKKGRVDWIALWISLVCALIGIGMLLLAGRLAGVV